MATNNYDWRLFANAKPSIPCMILVMTDYTFDIVLYCENTKQSCEQYTYWLPLPSLPPARRQSDKKRPAIKPVK